MPTDPLTLARDRAQENLFWRHLEVNVEDAGEGWVKLRVPVKDGFRNAVGAPVHGGVLSALVDMAVGGAVGTTHEGPGGGVGNALRVADGFRRSGLKDCSISGESQRICSVIRAASAAVRAPSPSMSKLKRSPGWCRRRPRARSAGRPPSARASGSAG